MPNIEIYQIFYDDSSRRSLDRGFIPLDNCNSARPDWYEFLPILTFLDERPLDPDSWYGFLSPKFFSKTNLGSSDLRHSLDTLDPTYQVALFSSELDQIAIYQNVFEQGERWHPGLLASSRSAIELLGCDYDVETAAGTLFNSVFSNYVIAKAAYWQQWHVMARRFLEICDAEVSENHGLHSSAPHARTFVPMRVFLQERLSALVLSNGSFRTYVPDENLRFERFPDVQRRFLIRCEELKGKYAQTGETRYLHEFRALRTSQFRRAFPLG